MAEMDKPKKPPVEALGKSDVPAPSVNTDTAADVFETCNNPRTAWELTSHFLGGFYGGMILPTRSKFDGWEQLVSGARQDVTGKLGRVAGQMDKHGYPDIASKVREIRDLIAQPVTEEVVEAVSTKTEELRQISRI